MNAPQNPPATAPAAQPAPPAHSDSSLLSSEQAQAMLRFLEAAAAVRRRYQFFVWTQSQLQALVPHQLMVCGAYLRQRRAVVFDAFHNIVLSPALLQDLTDADGALLAALVAHWVDGGGQPRAIDLARLDGAAGLAAQPLLDGSGGLGGLGGLGGSGGLGGLGGLGHSHLLLHGVARPQRPTEIESFFIFGGSGGPQQMAQRSACLDLVLPHLHSTWQRVTATEHALKRHLPQPAAPTPPSAAPLAPARGTVTERERQILRWVREGKSNQQIGEVLGISPLTVKNHIQKILRKLGAGNRAQAVAQALAQDLIDPADRLVAAPAHGPTPRSPRGA